MHTRSKSYTKCNKVIKLSFSWLQKDALKILELHIRQHHLPTCKAGLFLWYWINSGQMTILTPPKIQNYLSQNSIRVHQVTDIGSTHFLH